MTVFNLSEIEKKAYRSTFQDGLWDIFLGSVLLVLSISALLSNIGTARELHMGVLIVLQILVVAAFTVSKKRITVPRMGFVKFGCKRKLRITKSRIVLLVSVLAGVVLFLVASLVIQVSQAGRSRLLLLAPLGWVVNSIVVFSFLAYYLDFNRLYLYGVLFALPVPFDVAVRQFTGVNLSPIAFAVPATVILAVGIVLLVRFLHKYPESRKDMYNENPD